MAIAARAKPRKDLSKWLTRIQVCDLAGVSYDTVIKWQKRGLLHPEYSREHGRTSRPITVYDPQELANLPQFKRHTAQHSSPIDPGEQTARAFELFDRGATLREVVIDLRITVAQAEVLLEQWRDVGAPIIGNNLVAPLVANAAEPSEGEE
jgi:hypothetical protein